MLLGILGAGCAQEPRFTAVPRDGAILAFGDSLTYGVDENRESSYPSQLEKILGRQVINAGAPGELSSQGVQRLPGALKEYRPSLLILIHGGNDLLQGKDGETLRENLKAMIDEAKKRGIQVLLVAVPRPGMFLKKIAAYQDAARETVVPCLDGILKDILRNGALKSDLIHPNAEGNRRLAEGIAQFLRNKGAIE